MQRNLIVKAKLSRKGTFYSIIPGVGEFCLGKLTLGEILPWKNSEKFLKRSKNSVPLDLEG
jgi:hypothetical protein